MVLMCMQEDETLCVRGTDACIQHGVGITAHRNVNIDFREQRVRAQVRAVFLLGLLGLASRTGIEISFYTKF